MNNETEAQRRKLTGCGSHSCAVVKPTIGNNGPCRCLVSDYRGQSLIQNLEATIERQEATIQSLEAYKEAALHCAETLPEYKEMKATIERQDKALKLLAEQVELMSKIAQQAIGEVKSIQS